MNNENKRIASMMQSRRNRLNELAKKRFGSQNENLSMKNGLLNENISRFTNERVNTMINNTLEDSKMRSDNDLDIIERSQKLENNAIMSSFDESYYLDNKRRVKKPLNEGIALMNANGEINEKLRDDRKISRSEMLKIKALDLETLIVERLTRDRISDAKRIFNVLQKMYNKYDDENVRDIYYRVLYSMPKESSIPDEVYSYAKDKNNFKDVLNELSNNNNVKPFNEDNTCLNSLSQMWEECDIDICSEKCKKKILDAKEESDKDECKKLITGVKNGKDIKMKDDILNLILNRVKYCKKVSDLKKGNFDIINYSDKLDLKNKVIEDIVKMARLANMHYNSCHDKAIKLFTDDPKYRKILNILKNIDFHALSLERLQEIRNELTKLPTCTMLKHKQHEDSRDENVKNGIRVGPYIIPKNTDYYEQIKSKDRPFVYKDLAKDTHYLYDSYSKTLTELSYPITEENLINQKENNNQGFEEEETDGPSISNALYSLDFKDSPSESNKNKKNESESPTYSNENNNNQNNENENNENENNENNENDNNNGDKVLFNLSLKQLVEYLFLIFLVFIVLLTFSLVIPN